MQLGLFITTIYLCVFTIIIFCIKWFWVFCWLTDFSASTSKFLN